MYSIGDEVIVSETQQKGKIVKIDGGRPTVLTVELTDVNGVTYEKLFFEEHVGPAPEQNEI